MTLERSRTGISSPTSMGLSFGLCSMGWMKAGSTSPMAEKCDGSFFFWCLQQKQLVMVVLGGGVLLTLSECFFARIFKVVIQ
jgi:hypothetical protein